MVSHPAYTLGSRRKRETHPATPRSLRAQRGDQLRGKRILVVDDEPLSARLLGAILEAEGCEARAVTSAEEALAVIPLFRPDLVVLDMVLPRMSGLLLAQVLKADPRTRNIVLVVVTGVDGPEAERVATLAGCAAYLTKPIDTETFAKVVASALAGGK